MHHPSGKGIPTDPSAGTGAEMPQNPSWKTAGGAAEGVAEVDLAVPHSGVQRNLADPDTGRVSVPELVGSLISDLPGLFLLCDGHRRIIRGNHRCEVLLGYSVSELCGRDLVEFVVEGERVYLGEKLHLLPETGSFDARVHLAGKTGNRIPCSLSASIMVMGGTCVIVALGSPVTEGLQAEEALQESEQRFKELSELLPQAVYETDEHGVLTFANRPSIDWFGYTPEDFKSPFIIFRVISPEEREKAIQNFQKTLRGERSAPAEYTAIKKDGTRFTMMTYASPIIRHGRPVGLRGLAIDISERKRMEEAIHTANRKIMLLNSITRHDILNTVTALMGYTSLVKESTDLRDIASLTGRIEKTTERIRQQIEFTRDYQELGIHGPQWQSAEGVALSAIAPLRTQGVGVEIHLERLQVYADMLLGKVFYNLVDNSLRHGGSGLSSIHITWREDPRTSVIIYTDNGTGVAEDQKERIFAYGVGKGTGLGLFLSREILSLTGIGIRETGETKKGARFEISLPPGCYQVSASPR